MITEPSYQEMLESCARFNKRMCIERRGRLPFVDSMTGVAQNHSNLWRNERDREIVQPTDALDVL